MSRGPDAATQLLRAIIQDARRAGCGVTITESDWTRWSSATFAGARHDITVEGPSGAALDAWLAALSEADLTTRSALVADVSVAKVERRDGGTRARIEALTVDL